MTIVVNGEKKLIEISTYAEMQKHLNENVIVFGKISDEPWQHIVGNFNDYKYSYYFDLKDIQIVLYSKNVISNNREMKIIGKVVKVCSKSKKLNDGTEHCEYHILVDNVIITK